MEFKKSGMGANISGQWRLASVSEVRSNLEKIKEKRILDSWDIARLLDGWVDGPGYRYTFRNEYRSNMGHMLLVKTPVSRSSDGSFTKEMYDGVQLSNEGREAALLLSCEHKTTEIICFVLQSIVESFEAPDKRQAELDRLTKRLEKKFRSNRTVLHYAADEPQNPKHAEYVAKLLLQSFEFGKELIKGADKFGRTALHFSALHGNIDLCEFLMKECELKTGHMNRNGENLLHFAVNSNKVDVVKSLCRLEEVKILIDSKDSKGKTPLHKAAAKGNIDIIKFLLEQTRKKEDFVRQDDLFGQTALHEAAHRGHTEAVELLLNQGSNPLAERNSDGKTALHYAVHAKENAVEVAKLLLGKCSKEERSLLLWASASGIGTAEKSAEPLSPVQVYLKGERELAKESSTELLISAIKLEREDIALELISRGAKTHCLTNFSDPDPKLRERVKNFRERIKKIPERGRDQPTIEDTLGRRAFAEGLAALYLNPYVKTPLTVGITGDWGMGKSSLMMQTEMILVKTAAQLAFPNLLAIEEFPGHKQFEFNRSSNGRRKYEKIKDAVTDLLASEDTDQKIDEAVTDLLASEEFTDPHPQLSPQGRAKYQNIKQAIRDIADADPKGRRNYKKFIGAMTNFIASDEFKEADCGLSPKERKSVQKIKKAVIDILANAHPLLYLLDNYQEKHHEVYRSLAAMDRKEMFVIKDQTPDSSSSQYSLGKIPNILTVRYNAWHYRTESEAWAGLAVNITKVIEETMTRAQRIRCRWRYAWSQHKDKILFNLFLPCLLSLFISGWLAWVLWMLLSISEHEKVVDLKYGSIPVTVVVVVWTVMKQLVSVLKPISVQIMGYANLLDHKRNLGYQNQVISDINFLKNEMSEKPSWFWKFLVLEWLWSLCGLYPDTIKGTSIPKFPPPSKDDVRIIVFVDDLDRCQDTVILQVLSAVNLVLAACGINVVLGMDKNMIARAISNKFQGCENQNMLNPVDLAEKYISKIVQLPLALTHPGDEETKNFVDKQLGETFERGTNIAEQAPIMMMRGISESSADYSLNGSREDIGTNSNIPKPSHTVNISCDPPSSEAVDHETRDASRNVRKWCSGGLWSKISMELKRNGLRGSGSNIEMLKLRNTLLNSVRMMPTYTSREQEVLAYLRKLTMNTRKVPREWKQFLTYHRFAWNILSQTEKVQRMPGWQVQLLVWIFCCWQWKDRINDIIKNWTKLVVVNGVSLSDDDLSLKNIVEQYVDEMLLHHMNNDNNIQEEQKIKAEAKKKNKEDEEMKMEVEDEKKYQEDEWRKLKETLVKYDVSRESLEFFQKFHLNCDA